MSDKGYMFLAFFIIWGGVALYLWRLASLRQELARRVRRLEDGCRPSAKGGE
jgi:CcmD family protein